jgi:hypothetical protein
MVQFFAIAACLFNAGQAWWLTGREKSLATSLWHIAAGKGHRFHYRMERNAGSRKQ